MIWSYLTMNNQTRKNWGDETFFITSVKRLTEIFARFFVYKLTENFFFAYLKINNSRKATRQNSAIH